MKRFSSGLEYNRERSLGYKVSLALALAVVNLFAISLPATEVKSTDQPARTEDRSIELAVMSFNIRNGKANDGINSWEHRKDFVCDVISESNLDIVGLQEAFRFQLDWIEKRLPEFAEIGEGRDGKERGEYSAILYRKSRFTPQESGTFWLSDTPEVRSRNWGNRYLRICTWARLKEQETGHCFYIYNTHLDHESQHARFKSAQLIDNRIANRHHLDPFILTGDFNADESNPVVTYLKGQQNEHPAPAQVVDTFRMIHPDATRVGTGGGFEGREDGKKIDYIFIESSSKALSASIIRTQRQGRFPSDHSPVTATVVLPIGK